MTELSKLVYKTCKGELRLDELTDDATALARFELSADEQSALRRNLDNGQWVSFAPKAVGGWY